MSLTLFLVPNYKGTWDVLDEEDFCFGEGETPEEAISSARKTSDAPIETYWGKIEGDDF